MSTCNTIGFGCVGLSAQPSERNALQLLATAFNEGVNHFDTAPLYGKGYSEKILGKFIKDRRHEVVIATKFGLSGTTGSNIPAWLALPLNQLKKKIKKKPSVRSAFQVPGILSYRKIDLSAVRDSFEKSLRNLQTDHIDYYLLHEALPSFLTDEAMKYITELKQKGIVKKIGVAASHTNFTNGISDNFANWDVLQYENSLLHPSDNLLEVYPDKMHFYHSVLKPLQYKKITGDLKNELPGILLARAQKINPYGSILFSTSKPGNIKTNFKNLDLYCKYSLTELDNILSNAIH
ncbi:MAG TPA: aldo/keto reductase [Ferruginibacter sp.]|jgi:D-threo-aldose 1-dehydrogenase|nr:aldo/keto reductase [Ferruginibacter sp.]